jgi:hypothetical protein
MRIHVLASLVGLIVAQQAEAADPTQLIGTWAAHVPNGATMMTEFTATTFSFYALDPSGKPTAEPKRTYEVTYKDLGDSIAIEFKEHAGGAMVVVKSQDTATLVFPGSATFPMSRIQP